MNWAWLRTTRILRGRSRTAWRRLSRLSSPDFFRSCRMCSAHRRKACSRLRLWRARRCLPSAARAVLLPKNPGGGRGLRCCWWEDSRRVPPISWARLWRDSFDMMKRAKEIIGIFFIVGIAGTIVIFAQRAKALEERDRMTLEEVKEIRIALQQYFDAHQRFPEELPPDIAGGARYGYQCTQ